MFVNAPDAVRELLLLPPQDVVRQERVVRRVKGGAEKMFLHLLLPLGREPTAHLERRIRVHGEVEEFPVEERDARFDAPGHGGLTREIRTATDIRDTVRDTDKDRDTRKLIS